MTDLVATYACVYPGGDTTIRFSDKNGTVVREQLDFLARNGAALIDHQARQMICSRGDLEFHPPAGYQVMIDPQITDLFLKTDRPCDCTDCQIGGWSLIKHARGRAYDMIGEIREKHPEFNINTQMGQAHIIREYLGRRG